MLSFAGFLTLILFFVGFVLQSVVKWIMEKNTTYDIGGD